MDRDKKGQFAIGHKNFTKKKYLNCQVEGCKNLPICKGYCGKHYQRWKKFGDPLHIPFSIITSLKQKERLSCQIEGCNNPVRSHGYCNKHYIKLRRYGDPIRIKRLPLKEFLCQYCGKEFYRDASQVKRGRIKFCSIECSAKAHQGEKSSRWKRVKVNCLVCGKEFFIKASWLKRGRGKCCSRECYYKTDAYLIQRRKTLTTGKRIKRICLYCKKEFEVLESSLKNERDGLYCSKKCQRKSNPRGEKAYNWRGGITPIHQVIRHSEQAVIWRQKVFERDNYTCQRCSKRGVVLNAHHIKPFSKFPELRFDVNNGITLCKSCHYKEPKGRQIHSLYKNHN